MNFQLPAKISFKVESPNIKDGQGNQAKPLHWDNVNAVIDFHNSRIDCEFEATIVEALALQSFDDAVEITALSIDYNGFTYVAEVGKIEFYICHVSSSPYSCTEEETDCPKCKISFSLRKSVIPLIPRDEERKNYLVFSGANRDEFRVSVQYGEQQFHFQSARDSELLTVSSDREISPEHWQLITLAYSLYQNGEIKILESHSASEFQLYVQLPPPAGTRLCKDKDIFLLIWNWLTQDDAFKSQRNILDFFLAGTRSRGIYLDFRLINLFICMNSICRGKNTSGRREIFGEEIAKNFDIQKGDGYWLAYIRNYLVHEGKSIFEAIDGAFSDFAQNQIKNGLKIERYACYATTRDKDKLALALYCDMIDLLMAYFMKTIGYDKPINEMHRIYGVSV